MAVPDPGNIDTPLTNRSTSGPCEPGCGGNGGTVPDTHEERIRAAFTPQAATFEDARLNVAFTSSVPWLLDHMAAEIDDIVLDVAGGTGIVSRAMANRVARVVVVDSTPAMIDEGRRQAASERLTNSSLCAARWRTCRSPTRRSPLSSPASSCII
jgi:predicted TPR repeat methyltransferase